MNYYEYKNDNLDKKEFAQKLLNENSRATSFQAQLIRISKAKSLFDHNKNIEALQLVINSNSSQISDELKQNAQEILNDERK
ncbi:hypothetical protein D3C80_2126220 [compost metagenome]